LQIIIIASFFSSPEIFRRFFEKKKKRKNLLNVGVRLTTKNSKIIAKSGRPLFGFGYLSNLDFFNLYFSLPTPILSLFETYSPNKQNALKGGLKSEVILGSLSSQTPGLSKGMPISIPNRLVPFYPMINPQRLIFSETF
jgi:hypothetical protein